MPSILMIEYPNTKKQDISAHILLKIPNVGFQNIFQYEDNCLFNLEYVKIQLCKLVGKTRDYSAKQQS